MRVRRLLAKLGHSVIGVDIDQYKVDSILSGKSPFFEPELEPLISETLNAKTLTATTDAAGALAQSDIAMICVGTPSQRNGSQDLSYLERVLEEIAENIKDGRAKPLILAIRSTVAPGTCEQLVTPAIGAKATVVSHPEFLREGQAVRDFFKPPLLVVGGDNREAVQAVADLYKGLPGEACLVSLGAAEMIKYACNAFHALKVAFANEMGTLCDQRGVSGAEVMATLCRDTTLNISPAYLKPGFAFGGSCLPKDLRALVHGASRMDLNLPLIESILGSNREHLREPLSASWNCPESVSGFSDSPSKKIPTTCARARSWRYSSTSSARDAAYASSIRTFASITSTAATSASC